MFPPRAGFALSWQVILERVRTKKIYIYKRNVLSSVNKFGFYLDIPFQTWCTVRLFMHTSGTFHTVLSLESSRSHFISAYRDYWFEGRGLNNNGYACMGSLIAASELCEILRFCLGLRILIGLTYWTFNLIE